MFHALSCCTPYFSLCLLSCVCVRCVRYVGDSSLSVRVSRGAANDGNIENGGASCPRVPGDSLSGGQREVSCYCFARPVPMLQMLLYSTLFGNTVYRSLFANMVYHSVGSTVYHSVRKYGITLCSGISGQLWNSCFNPNNPCLMFSNRVVLVASRQEFTLVDLRTPCLAQ